MTNSDLHDLAARWRAVRRLHKTYLGIVRQGKLEALPSTELDSPIDHSDPEVLQRAEEWLTRMDNLISVYHLRVALQLSVHADEELLRTLISHHLKKQHKDDFDRDKLDFLLAQYFSQNTPAGAEDNVDFTCAAEVLQKALGEIGEGISGWQTRTDELLTTASDCENLGDLLEKRVLERGRDLKQSAGQEYFRPAVLVSLTRFNYLVRRIFFRLLLAEVEATFEVLRHLQQRGITTIDCREAGLSERELVARLCEMCQDWQTWFRAEYGAGQPLRQLIQIHSAAQHALDEAKPASEGKKKAAAAASGNAGQDVASA